MNPPVALTIAGSDSGGGAGIEADLKTFSALGVFGTVAITAVTAQNTAVVAGVTALDPEFVRLQVETVLSDLPVASVKTGMLANSSIVRMVGSMAREGVFPHLVVDPVLVSTSGGRLLDEDAIPVYIETLLPFVEVVTPNLREAKLLSGLEINDVDEMIEAAHRIAAYGPANVVVKGGHLKGALSPDVVVSGDEVRVLEGIWIPTNNDHGTGCSLSSATAAYLARGESVGVSIERAKEFVSRAIAGAVNWSLGAGHGPLDHFGWNLQ